MSTLRSNSPAFGVDSKTPNRRHQPVRVQLEQVLFGQSSSSLSEDTQVGQVGLQKLQGIDVGLTCDSLMKAAELVWIPPSIIFTLW